MSMREIQGQLLELYGNDVSPALISTTTDEVIEEFTQWQTPLSSLDMRLRKIAKNRGHFRGDEAATKLLFLALRNVEKDWKMPQRTWKLAANQFAMMFGEHFMNAFH